MTNIYLSEATIAPREDEKQSSGALSMFGGLGGIVAEGLGLGGGGSLDKLEITLNSRSLTSRVIEKYKLMPVIFSDTWDRDKKKWTLRNNHPTFQDGCKVMQDLLIAKVDPRNGTLKIGFEHKDPKTAKKFVDYYLVELSETLRQEVIRDATENMRFFREQIGRTSDPLLKEKIYAMLAREIEKDTFARAQKYYSFVVLDPPIVPDLDKYVKPKRKFNLILSVVVAFFLAIFLAFVKEYARRLKIEDRERYQELVRGLKFWKSKGKAGERD
jgi:uncharacterized protein involved in exopolysaccharide biosynthesis